MINYFNIPNQPPKFRTNYWVETNYESQRAYKADNEI